MMKKLIILACVLAAGAAQAESVKERKARCTAQGELFAQAIELRLKRTGERKARAAVMEAAPEGLKGSVTQLVGFAYTLARRDAKRPDLVEAFVQKCSDFDPKG